MEILTVILNSLLLLLIILSLLDGDWQVEDTRYQALFLSAPAASLCAILRKS